MIQILNEDISDVNLLNDSPCSNDTEVIEEIVLPTSSNHENVLPKHQEAQNKQETLLKYTCKDCNLATTRKQEMDIIEK